MTSHTIDLPDDQVVALKTRAAEEGLSLEGWASRQSADSIQWPAPSRLSTQAAAARILELQKDVKPDPMAGRSKITLTSVVPNGGRGLRCVHSGSLVLSRLANGLYQGYPKCIGKWRGRSRPWPVGL